MCHWTHYLGRLLQIPNTKRRPTIIAESQCGWQCGEIEVVRAQS